ncbi:MAG TPA: hypothetical protein VLF14_09220 [Candidatus Binatia bacterium]|nr:hypothetical protein [Candidatus Binatia bacterium]
MMNPARWRWLLVPLLLLPACSYSVVRKGEISQRAAARIERGLEQQRGLRFLSPVPMEIKSPEELQTYLRRELDRQYSPEQIRGLEQVYERLGLWPANVDLGEALLKLYNTQIAGFYDAEVGTLFLVPSAVPPVGWRMSTLEFLLQRDLVNEMLLSHELTHALQDQHFGALSAANDPSNDDRSLALHAVLEGDATLAGFAYVFGGLPEASLLDLVDRLGTIPAEVEVALPDTPPVLRDSLVFQYSAGTKFVALAYLRGGWTAVDALLAYPPKSTKQILWPEKFFSHPDSPTTVRLGGLDDYASGKQWTAVEENTLGALTIRILVESFLDPGRANQVAQGWDGDRFVAFGHNGELHLYWISIWDGEAAAKEFFSAETEILARTFPGAPRKADRDRLTAEGTAPYWLERRGDKILLALGVPAKDVSKRVEEVWAKTTFAPEEIHLDLDLARMDSRSAAPHLATAGIVREPLAP